MNLAGLAGAQAFLVEGGGDLRVAAERHAAVGAQWRTLGARLEQAYSVLGQGRCLTRLDDRAPESTLQEARRLFAAMGAHARVEDCDALLVRVSRLSS